MRQYIVTGMSCAACSARVEKAVSQLDGVNSCSVSLLTNSMGVEGNVSDEAVIKAVTDAGYGASVKGKTNDKTGNVGKKNSLSESEEMLKDKETPVLRKRLLSSLIFLVVLMYFSMGHMMWGWPLPGFFVGNHVAMGLLQLLLTIAIMIINKKFFVSGIKSLIHGAPNMDTLVALGSSAAFVYSTYALFAMTDAQVKGGSHAAAMYMDEFYFESAAMILTLITVGKMLEAYSKGKTTDAIKSLMRLAPKTAVVLRDEKEVQVESDEVEVGDIFVVRPGENIPVDGTVVEGSSAVNEASLTGESIPVDKECGDKVSAATLNTSGFLKCKATRVGEDTTLSQIIQMVSDAAETKAPIAKIADKVSGIFVPAVITIAVITILIWLLCGQSIGFALARGISVLVISCPCALGLATPVAIMVGNGLGARNGIMFKTAVSLEETGKMQIVALDKTGTITSGNPVVTDVLTAQNVSSGKLLELANSMEIKSEHPLAKAVTQYAKDNNIGIVELSNFEAVAGNGLVSEYDGHTLYGGNARFVETKCKIESNIKEEAERLAKEGKTPLYFGMDDKILGIIAVADEIKDDSKKAIKELQNMGLKVVMLTGDNEKTAKAIASQVGVDEVIAGVLPDGKEKVIRKLQEDGKVLMVGDGINDAPALTRADIGMAIGAGTDIAIDAADIVLMKSSLSDVAAAIRLSRATLRNIHENLFWAFIYNIIGIPLAAGVLIPIWNIKLNPMFGAAAMSLSSFCVVSNALRLNLFKLYDSNKDKKINNKNDKQNNKKKVEEKSMEKTMKIEGMMCGHCEANVKKTLEALQGVAEAIVSHTEGTAIVKLSADVADDVLKNTVEAKDYKVVDIK